MAWIAFFAMKLLTRTGLNATFEQNAAQAEEFQNEGEEYIY